MDSKLQKNEAIKRCTKYKKEEETPKIKDRQKNYRRQEVRVKDKKDKKE